MHLIAKYPFWFLFFGLGVVLAVVALFGAARSAPPSASTVSVFGGGALINPGFSSAQRQSVAPNSEPSPGSPAPAYAPITFATTSAAGGSASTSAAPQSSAGGTQTSVPAQSADSLLRQLYSLMPSGIMLRASAPVRTPAQEALYTYANEAGLALLTFQSKNAGAADALKQWLGARGDATKSAAVGAIAADLLAAGDQLSQLAGVPASAAASNAALAASFKGAGQKLLAVEAAGTDDAKLIDALKSYDVSADQFTLSYLAIVDLLSLNNVRFNSTDTGSVFSFSSAGSP